MVFERKINTNHCILQCLMQLKGLTCPHSDPFCFFWAMQLVWLHEKPNGIISASSSHPMSLCPFVSKSPVLEWPLFDAEQMA